MVSEIKMTSFQWLRYYLSEHPSIVRFRWSHTQLWGSTWSFLVTAISLYISAALLLHILLLLFRHRRPIPLGPFPAAHSLCMALICATIFAGTLLSAVAEIRESRWLWRRSRTTPLKWLLCFPVGTRPSGRVFFWSYVFYLSRFLHGVRSFIAILRHRKISYFQLLSHSISICVSFLWLEFSQSFQVIGILLTTLVNSVVYGYRFWTAVGLPGACFPLVVNCQIILLACNLVCHCAVLMLHFITGGGGCNGIGAWLFNSVLNGAVMLLFLNSYLKMHFRKINPASDGSLLTAEIVKER